MKSNKDVRNQLRNSSVQVSELPSQRTLTWLGIVGFNLIQNVQVKRLWTLRRFKARTDHYRTVSSSRHHKQQRGSLLLEYQVWNRYNWRGFTNLRSFFPNPLPDIGVGNWKLIGPYLPKCMFPTTAVRRQRCGTSAFYTKMNQIPVYSRLIRNALRYANAVSSF